MRLILYQTLLRFSIFVLKLLRPFLPSKIKEILRDRDQLTLPLLADRPIWIHAASGEIEYAKPVIRTIQSQYPKVPIVVSYFSPSALRLMPPTDEMLKIFPLPWDLPWEMRKVIETLNPHCLLIARTDAWPTMIHECHDKKIPTLLFAATISPGSRNLSILMRSLFRQTLSRMSQIQCVSQEDLRIFENLSKSLPIRMTGDTRFDQVLYRIQHPRLKTPRPGLMGKVLVAGSTWPEDEREILSPCLRFVKMGNSLIIAPHEPSPSHLDELESFFRREKIRCQRLSDLVSGSSSQNDVSVLLVDQIGVLADIYSWGDCAFVGGSFKSRVHSVMEALAHGLPVAVGPFHQNNREAVEFQALEINSLPAVMCVKGGGEFSNWLSTIGSRLDPSIHKDLQNQVAARAGATTRVMEFLETRAHFR